MERSAGAQKNLRGEACIYRVSADDNVTSEIRSRSRTSNYEFKRGD